MILLLPLGAFNIIRRASNYAGQPKLRSRARYGSLPAFPLLAERVSPLPRQSSACSLAGTEGNGGGGEKREHGDPSDSGWVSLPSPSLVDSSICRLPARQQSLARVLRVHDDVVLLGKGGERRACPGDATSFAPRLMSTVSLKSKVNNHWGQNEDPPPRFVRLCLRLGLVPRLSALWETFIARKLREP